MNSGQFAADGLFRDLQVICRLQVNPVLGGLAERLAEKQGYFGSNGSSSPDEM
jgi:hypothetical protein